MTDKHEPAQLIIGATGIGIGFIDQVVHWAQIISVVGGAIIVVVTLIGMLKKAWKDFNTK